MSDNESKFTPGPWTVYTKDCKFERNGKIGSYPSRFIVTEWVHPQLETPVPVVTISVGLGGTNIEIREKDAVLIAAAPELLKALESLYRAVMYAGSLDDIFNDGMGTTMDDVVEIIKKARGEK